MAPRRNLQFRVLSGEQFSWAYLTEEHFVIETPAADRYRPGDAVFAVPTHICPTCALHRQAYVIEAGQVTECWDIVARDRVLTV